MLSRADDAFWTFNVGSESEVPPALLSPCEDLGHPLGNCSINLSGCRRRRQVVLIDEPGRPAIWEADLEAAAVFDGLVLEQTMAILMIASPEGATRLARGHLWPTR
jgi:hypothetical protein